MKASIIYGYHIAMKWKWNRIEECEKRMIMIYYKRKGYKNRWHTEKENRGDKKEKMD
jgi:hypothetical protein